MVSGFVIEQIMDCLLPLLKGNMNNTEHDFEEKIKIILQSYLTDLNFVSREEFDRHAHVLLKTRLKLEALEKQVNAIDVKINE